MFSLENACCNESLDDIIPIVYFNKENPLCKEYLQHIVTNNKLRMKWLAWEKLR